MGQTRERGCRRFRGPLPATTFTRNLYEHNARQTSAVYEHILKVERERLLAALNPSHVQIWGDDVPSRNNEAAVMHDHFLSLAVNELELHKLRQVEASLKRIRNGTYGICET